ncbi:MAG: type II and III secretion system protein family protein [Deltaproteobacteria bacterium]|nr:MAG: type II and III secretion system protein family protein [Deltaproteobacteria bacterium]
MNRQKGVAVILLLACLGLTFPVAARATFKQGVEGASATKLHLKANQSFLLDTTLDIRRVSIGKPEIADVTVVTPKQLMVTGKAPGETTLIYWTAAGVPTSVDVNVWVENGARKSLEAIVPGEKFEMSGTPETMILTGSLSSETAQHRLVESAKAYTKNVVNLLAVERVEQVMLQVRVAEVDRKIVKELGVNFLFKTGDVVGGTSPPNGFSPFSGEVNPLAAGGVLPALSFSDAVNLFVAKPGTFAAFLRAMNDRGALKMLAEPNLIVANGGEGKFLAGGEFPVVYNTSNGGTAGTTVIYKEFGVRLNFQPKITPNGEIQLKIYQEVSELDFGNAVVLTGFRIPSLKSRKAESSLQLGDGQTFALAGLIDNKISKQVSKIPLLGDIPILGALFRSTRYQKEETELVVMVTPTIIRPYEKGKMPELPTDRMNKEEIDPSVLKD